MTIQKGYNSKQLHIRISASSTTNRTAEVWIEQEGLMIPLISPKTNEVYTHHHSETLAYATLDELLNLQDELKSVIQELVA